MTTFSETLRHPSGATAALSPTRLLLAFKKPFKQEELKPILKELGFALEETADVQGKKETKRPMFLINHTDTRFWVRSVDNKPVNDKSLQMLWEKFGQDLDWIGPVYQVAGEKKLSDERALLFCPVPNVLVLKIVGESANTRKMLTELARRYALKEVEEKSKYLKPYRYFVIADPQKFSAYQLRNNLVEYSEVITEVRFENMPMTVPIAISPNDTHFAQQWNMTRIQAGGPGTTAWDLSTGVNAVVVAVLDTGCDLTHPDLQFSTPGIRLDTMGPDGSPTGDHGTACAGIVAATFNNAAGVAGVAGNCRIMPLAFVNWTDTEVAAGINFASSNGAQVISMSFGYDAWDHAVIDPAIQNAHNNGVVMCVATHNYNSAITYPATNPLVIACGASDQADNRKSPSSPDGECWWGSNFGAEISVVAPGVRIWTTDRQGAAGYNQNGNPVTLTSSNAPCLGLGGTLTYATTGDAAGDYFANFNGTSAATPHVAGLAALVRSLYPALTNVQVREIIEKTAEKVGTVAYADVAGHPNGTWNQEMGYGRINALRALDYADVMIKDYPGDTGTEPSTPPGGNYWDFSDIVVRINDDNAFVPSDISKSRYVERGQTNYLYIRATNNGPREARNVVVNARITPYVGLQFIYPTDWTTVDATHASPTPVINTFASIPSGGTVMAKFTISAAQTEDFWGWVEDHSWHPCILASVTADNDYAFAAATTGGNLVKRRNNLAQRNLTVIDVLAGATATFPFIIGHKKNFERTMQVLVDRTKLPKNVKLLLSIDDDGSEFKLVDFTPSVEVAEKGRCGQFVFLERTKIRVTSCCNGILTLEKGSKFECAYKPSLENVHAEGGEVVIQNGKRFVDIKENMTVVTFEKQAGQIYPMSLVTSIPVDAEKEQQFIIRVSQRNQSGMATGGATAIYIIK
jgi:subtilisin family serine protease